MSQVHEFVKLPLTVDDWLLARQWAAKLPTPPGSVTHGGGLPASVIGKYKLGQYLGIDMVLTGDGNRRRVDVPGLDVHTKQRTVPPLASYNVTLDVPQFQAKGDVLAFVSLNGEEFCYLLGYITAERFALQATKHLRGAKDPDDSRFAFTADCYTLKTLHLYPVAGLRALLIKRGAQPAQPQPVAPQQAMF